MLKRLIIAVLCLQSWMNILTAAENENAAEKNQITQRLESFTDVINKGSNESIGSFWTEDAVFVVPVTGEVIDGRDAIAEYLKKKQQDFNGKTITFAIKNIDLTAPDAATVQGVVQFLDNGEVTERKARKLELVKQNGTWYIDSNREITVDLPPDLYSHLKDLEWLIGNWKDQDEDVTIEFDTQWDKFKNFLIQHFKSEVYGLEEMEGTQIIGWDPIEERIRSWVFDSDGGFGTGTWSKDGANWVVSMSYTLSDGRAASATSTFSNISNKSYTYTSTGRDVDGEVLPNIEPVTVVREE